MRVRIWGTAFSPDGKTFASSSVDGTIRFWDINSRTEKGKITGHVQWIAASAFSPDGSIFAHGSNTKSLFLWDLGALTETHTF